MTLVASVVLGSNTFRLLIAEREEGVFKELALASRPVRAGQGPLGEALERSRVCLEEFRGMLDEAGRPRIAAALTAVGRDPERGEALTSLAERILGVPVPTLTGEEEAATSLAGARAHLPAHLGPELLIDIGGGSTEIVASIPGSPSTFESLPLGVLSLSDRRFAECAERAEEVFLRSAFAGEAEWWRGACREGLVRFMGNAGTPVTLAAIINELPIVRSRAANGLMLAREKIAETARMLDGLTQEELSAHPGIAPGRRDLIIPGTAILLGFMALSGADRLTVADGGVCEGLLLTGPKRW